MASNKNENPMSLENLPDYLKSLKEHGSVGDSCVVDMGTIDSNPKGFFWTQRIIIAAAVSMILGTGGMIAYDLTATQQLTVLVDLNREADPTKVIPEMVSGGGKIIAVTKKDGSSAYEVKVSTRKSRKSFLEWLHKNKNVKEAK